MSADKEADSQRFHSTYETIGAFEWKGREILVWQPTSRYRIAAGRTLEECLESALAEIETGPLSPDAQADAEADTSEVADASRHALTPGGVTFPST